MTDFNVGDKVKVSEFEGTINALHGDRAGLLIRDEDGFQHEVYQSPWLTEQVVKVTKVEPPRPEGQIVRDSDGDMFIYEPSASSAEPWRLIWATSATDLKVGSRHPDHYVTGRWGPVTVLTTAV